MSYFKNKPIDVEKLIPQLTSPPTKRGFCIRSLRIPDEHAHSSCTPGTDVFVFIDGELMRNVQSVQLGIAADDLTIDATITMLATELDVDVDAIHISTNTAEIKEEPDYELYELGEPNPVIIKKEGKYIE